MLNYQDVRSSEGVNPLRFDGIGHYSVLRFHLLNVPIMTIEIMIMKLCYDPRRM